MRRIGAFALFALLVAGCTSSGDPAPPSAPVSTPTTTPQTTTTSPSAPATPTVPADVPTTGPNADPGESPPVEPILATRHSAAGAKAFAVFFIKTIDWAYATTSTTYMRHYFERSCVECRSVADAIDRDRQRGHHFIGGRFRVARAAQKSPVTIVVTLNITSLEVVTRDGKYVGGEGAHAMFREAVTLRWSAASWIVVGMQPQ